MTARPFQFECSSPRLQLITMGCLVSCKDIVSIVHNRTVDMDARGSHASSQPALKFRRIVKR